MRRLLHHSLTQRFWRGPLMQRQRLQIHAFIPASH